MIPFIHWHSYITVKIVVVIELFFFQSRSLNSFILFIVLEAQCGNRVAAIQTVLYHCRRILFTISIAIRQCRMYF